jgi:hypothetical protein
MLQVVDKVDYTNVGWLLSFDLVIKLNIKAIINNLPWWPNYHSSRLSIFKPNIIYIYIYIYIPKNKTL